MIPILRSTNDPHFRYKMQSIAISQEASRTIITNLDDISKSLHRDPLLIIKYLGSTLGCTQGRDGSKYFLNGRFNIERLQSLVYDFVDTYVLCQACGNPETKFVIEGGLFRHCSSCGATLPQPASKLNTVIARDVEKGVNEDVNYRQGGNVDIQNLIKSEGDVSGQVYDIYKRENLRLSDLFKSYVKPSNLKQFLRIFEEVGKEEIIESIEEMLENEKKEYKIGAFLKVLCRSCMSIEDVESYFRKLRNNKKRNPLIKKEADFFISNYDE
ncbi:translation initiation factor 5 [Pancytospora epiphaga]|nr:translation initiation factor 5 [Pancytospora epiphaga]